MSRLEIMSPTRARIVMEGLYKDLERRIESSPLTARVTTRAGTKVGLSDPVVTSGSAIA